MYRVIYQKCAEKYLRKASPELARRLLDRVEKLAIDPFPQEIVRVKDQKDKVFRVRVGNYRIQYIVSYETNIIHITDIDKRESAYEWRNEFFNRIILILN